MGLDHGDLQATSRLGHIDDLDGVGSNQTRARDHFGYRDGAEPFDGCVPGPLVLRCAFLSVWSRGLPHGMDREARLLVEAPHLNVRILRELCDHLGRDPPQPVVLLDSIP